MTDAIAALKARAAQVDQRMQDLAQDELGRMSRRAAYERLEDQFEQFAADNNLSPAELDKLKKEFRSLGLSTATLDALAKDMEEGGVEVTGRLRSDISSDLRAAMAETDNPFFNFEAGRLMAEYNEVTTAAANINKKLHDAYSTAINNLK